MRPSATGSWLTCAHCSPYPVQRCGQSIRSPQLYTPFRSAATAVIGLNDDPVGYRPNVARLKNGRFGSEVYRAIAAASPETSAFRPKVGRLASATISPDHGSS